MTSPPETSLPDLATLVERREHLEQRITDAGGDPTDIEILAVTKRFPPEAVLLAVDAGFAAVGENYGQELVEKAGAVAPLLDGRPNPQWHMIGGLQRNKIKKLAGVASVYQTVDRPALVTEIAKRDPQAVVYLQVNATAEPQKSGCRPDDVPSLVEACAEAELDLAGLMTIGPTDGSDPSDAFATVRRLVDDHGLRSCSMGMSGDLEAAVRAGTTMIRVGSALFGPRPTTL